LREVSPISGSHFNEHLARPIGQRSAAGSSSSQNVHAAEFAGS
jgi:hypothetical protein